MATARVVITLVASVSLGIAQDAQPQAEVNIVEKFEQASQVLFREWLTFRENELKATGLGEQGRHASSGCIGEPRWFVFTECFDDSPPKEYTIDVIRTDSLVSPFVGYIVLPVKETCHVRRVIASKAMTKKKFDALAPHCLGKTYSECISAGGKLAPKILGSACTGGPGFTYNYRGEVTLHYRWSKGKWEFEKQRMEPERKPPEDPGNRT